MKLTEKKTEIYKTLNLDTNETNIHEGEPYYFIREDNMGMGVQKLGQLEDIEENFGCDFIFLNKVCENGVYCYKNSIKSFNCYSKRLGNIIHIPNSDIHINFFGVYEEKRMGVSIMGCIDFVYHSLPIKDYGKTWAITREELGG